MATGPYGVDDSAFRHLLETDYSEYERRVEEEFTKNKYREELGREYDQKVAQGAIQPEAVQPVAGGDKSSLTKSDPMQTYENFGPKGGGMTSGAAARSQRRQEFRGLLEGLLADSLMENRKRREQFPICLLYTSPSPRD